MNEILETAGLYRVRLRIDEFPSNPRTEHDNLCHVITVSHPHYTDVEPNGGPLEAGWNRIKDRDDAEDVFVRWAKTFHGAVVEIHTPERGPRSIWYLTPKEIAEVGDPEKYIRGEIEEYQAWADGEVYGYTIERSVTWVPKGVPDGGAEMETWEEVDEGSCWGYYGYDYAKEAALEAFAPYKAEEN